MGAVVVSAALVAGSWALATLLAIDSRMVALDGVVRSITQARPDAWHGMRGALAYVAIPSLLILGALASYAIWQGSRRAAIVYAAVGLASNLTLQAVKHGHLPGSDELNPLSGHAGVAGAVCLGWLAFAPRRTSQDGWAAWGVTCGVSGGVILASWHAVPQVLCPLGIVTGWVVVGSNCCGVSSDGRPSARSPILVTMFGTAALGVTVGAAQIRGPNLVGHPWAAVAMAEAVVAAATVLAVGVVLLTRPAAESTRITAERSSSGVRAGT